MVFYNHDDQLEYTGQQEGQQRINERLAKPFRQFRILGQVRGLYYRQRLDRARAFKSKLLERSDGRAINILGEFSMGL